jgi:hypothetical protein
MPSSAISIHLNQEVEAHERYVEANKPRKAYTQSIQCSHKLEPIVASVPIDNGCKVCEIHQEQPLMQKLEEIFFLGLPSEDAAETG